MLAMEHLSYPVVMAGHCVRNEVGTGIQADGRLTGEPVREDRSWLFAAAKQADALRGTFLGL